TIAVYAVMPIAVGLLILAEQIPYVAPANWLAWLDGVYLGLSIMFSLAFIATALKSINDTLWLSILGTYILKSLPRQDIEFDDGCSAFLCFNRTASCRNNL
ncbi:MAG: hypothetical protein ACTSPB_16935, partial [Candidatus Thorarchaeota archaeon]